MEIEVAFKRLLVKDPFYGLFCMSLPKVITDKVETLAISKQGINCQLNINPDFWKEHTDDEQIALLKHELGHVCLQHMFISDSFADPKLFNISADTEINSYIENLPKSAVTAKVLGEQLGMTVENGKGTKYYYGLLSKPQQNVAQNPQKACNGGMGGNSSQAISSSSSPSEATPNKPEDKHQSGEDKSQNQSKGQLERGDEQYPDELKEQFKPIDSHHTWKDFKNIPEANKQLIVNNIHAILKQTAEQVEKSCGTIPGEFTELISKLREKRPEVFNWKAYFRRMLGSIYDVNIRMTRRRESKRFAGAAGIKHRKKVSILVAIDTSGSVSERELQEFFSEIDYVYKAGARITIIECDTRINSITEYDGKKLPEIKGRGGTSFNPPVDYYVDHRKEYASLIYFTDGEAPLPNKNPSGMVWVISSNGCRQDYPGKAVYIPQYDN